MEPEYLTATHWYWIASFVEAILWFGLLAIVGGLSILAGRAVIPSLIMTGQLAPQARLLQFGAYATGLIALGVAAYALAVALGYGFAVIGQFYPRWWI